MKAVGVEKADIGFAASNGLAYDRVVAVAKANAQEANPIEVSCAARTKREEDIIPIVEASQTVGRPITADAFIGTDPDRIEVEKWTKQEMVTNVRETARFATSHGIPIMIVTETSFLGIEKIPNIVKDIYKAALDEGARRVCLSDTTGQHLPYEIERGVKWMRKFLDKNGFPDVGIDFHGHDDLRCAVPNSIAAYRAGADRVHGTILGVGERAGNTDLIPLLIQMDSHNMNIGHDLRILPTYAMVASEALGIPIRDDEPGIGFDSRAQTSGVHAAAALKGIRAGKTGIYLAFDYAEKMGITPSHTTRIGPNAGTSNVLLYCYTNQLEEPTENQIRAVLDAAKKLTNKSALSDDRIRALLAHNK
jgi:2-isopropylmalate synthase